MKTACIPIHNVLSIDGRRRDLVPDVPPVPHQRRHRKRASYGCHPVCGELHRKRDHWCWLLDARTASSVAWSDPCADPSSSPWLIDCPNYTGDTDGTDTNRRALQTGLTGRLTNNEPMSGLDNP